MRTLAERCCISRHRPVGCESMSFHYYLLRKIDHPGVFNVLINVPWWAANIESCRIEAITRVIYCMLRQSRISKCAFAEDIYSRINIINIWIFVLREIIWLSLNISISITNIEDKNINTEKLVCVPKKLFTYSDFTISCSNIWILQHMQNRNSFCNIHCNIIIFSSSIHYRI